MENNAICTDLKSLIWNSISSTTVLGTIIGDITGVGLHTDPI